MDARRLIPVGAAVTALLVLAGIASHGRPLRSGSGAGPSAVFFDYVATTLLLVGAGFVVLLFFLIRAEAIPGRPPRSRWQLLSTITSLAAAVLIAELVLHSQFENRLRGFLQHNPPPHGQGRTGPGGKEPANGRNARVRWDEIALVLVLVAGVGVYLLATRQRKPLAPLRERRRRALSHALDESLDDLRSDPDVRRAIIAAYARMEGALAAAGLARAPAEAPFEYLERALGELETSAEAARRLTDLFERAKFSQHEPGEAMRDEAIDALIVVRDELRDEQPVAA